jgi:hypothetical protein
MDTIQAILAVKTDTDLSCEAFTEKLATNPGVLKPVYTLNRKGLFFRTIKILSKYLRYIFYYYIYSFSV